LDPPSGKTGAAKVLSPLAAVGRDSVEAALQQGAGDEKFKERLQSQNAVFVDAVVFLKKKKKRFFFFFGIAIFSLADISPF